MHPIVTVITPTTGKESLYDLIQSLHKQTVPHVHLMLWDNKREGDYLYPNANGQVCKPEALNDEGDIRTGQSIVIPDSMVQGHAAGSALRAVGLMIARTKYVTFADDDIWFDESHLETMVNALEKTNNQWVYCKRRIWTSDGEELGIDEFESVGDSPNRKVPYEMVDNNSMMFARRFGTSGACLYRETSEYNDDRLMYAFLKQYAGPPVVISNATVNQVCPNRLEQFFRSNCTK